MIAKYDVSIVVCCFNSANRLKKTLEHLAFQITKKVNCELIIVDNNSTDNTAEMALKTCQLLQMPHSFKIINEPKKGLSFARQTGIYNASGKYILFCDDDNWLQENYLEISFQFMENNLRIGVLGGNGIAVSSIELPNWFSTYQSNYAVGVQNIESGIINFRRYVWGSGMMVRTSDLLNMYDAGFVSLLTDRKGDDLSSGGDSEICSWFLIIGKDLYYNEQLIFKHFIEPQRLTKEYFERLKIGMSLSVNVLSRYNIVIDYLNKKNQLDFFKTVEILANLFLARKWSHISIFLEVLNSTTFVFNKHANSILKSRKVFIEKAK